MAAEVIRLSADACEPPHLQPPPPVPGAAGAWVGLVNRFGGTHHGYFLPSEGYSDITYALFSFPSLATYEQYRTDNMSDPECQDAFELARNTRCIKRYERRFLRPLDVMS